MGSIPLQSQGLATMTPEEFWTILHAPVAAAKIFYRLYHDDAGVPLFYSMEDLPGTYIELTQQQFNDAPSNIRIRDGAMIALTWTSTTKLVPSDFGIPCSLQNVAIVVAENNLHTTWNQKTYETN